MKSLPSFLLLVMILVSMDLLTGCESTPKAGEGGEPATAATPAQSKPPTLYSGLQAFSCVNGLAQRWSSDVIPVRLEDRFFDEESGEEKSFESSSWR